MESLSREALKDFLSNVIGEVTLDPTTHEFQINYRIDINLGDKVASQGDSTLSPGYMQYPALHFNFNFQ